jgi:hypothetical protein
MKLRKEIYTIGGLNLVIVLLSFTLFAVLINTTILSVMLILVGLVSFFGFIGLGINENDQELSKEDIRLAIVISLITFYLTAVGTVSMFAREINWPVITETMITHFTSIIGVVIAFYFGTEAYLAVYKKSSGESNTTDSSPVKTPAVKEVKKT